MDEKLKSTIDKIVQLSKQNPEFDAELRKRLEITSSAKSVYDEERIAQIYEYCIEKLSEAKQLISIRTFHLSQ